MAIANFDYPGVKVTEAVRGAIPLDIAGFKTGKMVGTALRGPVAVPTLITKQQSYHDLFGARTNSSYLDDAVRAWLENCDAPLYVVRVIGAGSAKATKTLVKAGTPQVETATVIGTIGAAGAGNATFTVTAAGMTGSPKVLNVAVANNDTAAQVAGKIRVAAAADVDITARFAVSGAGADVVLTRLVAGGNDATLNMAIANGTCTGLTAAPTSANTTLGVADVDVLQIDSYGPGADYNYVASPAHGVSVTLVAGFLIVYDGGVAKEWYRDVLAANSAAKIQEINGGSSLIQVTWLDPTKDPDDYAAATGLLGGADGASVTSTTIIGDESADPKTGIYAFADDDQPLGFLMAPGYPQQTVGLALIDVAERFRLLALIDSTYGINSAAAITERQQYAAPQGHALYIYGWVETNDLDTGALKFVPRSPFRAAHIARSHNQPGSLANVGAGVDYVLRNVTRLEKKFDNTEHGELNRNGVDIARDFSREGYGKVHWAARTVSALTLYRFLQVRVIFNVIAESIETGLKPYVFRPIDGRGRLAEEIKTSISQLLWTLWNDDVLFGSSPEDAYLVKVDMSNRSQLEAGILNVDVYAKPTPIAERINVTLYRVPLAFDFRTGKVTVGSIEEEAA
jgi:hypothetical protein